MRKLGRGIRRVASKGFLGSWYPADLEWELGYVWVLGSSNQRSWVGWRKRHMQRAGPELGFELEG